MDECEPLPPASSAVLSHTCVLAPTSAFRMLNRASVLPLSATLSAVTFSQGLTLVHVRAQLEQLQGTFMS